MLLILGMLLFIVLFIVGGCKLAFKLNTTLDGQVHERPREVTQEELQFFHDRYVISGGKVGSPKYMAKLNEWCANLACVDGVIINKEKELFYDPAYQGSRSFTIRFVDGLSYKTDSIIGLTSDKAKNIEIGQAVIGYCVADEHRVYHLMGIAVKG